jgi:hypothetical protein
MLLLILIRRNLSPNAIVEGRRRSSFAFAKFIAAPAPAFRMSTKVRGGKTKNVRHMSVEQIRSGHWSVVFNSLRVTELHEMFARARMGALRAKGGDVVSSRNLGLRPFR